MVEVYLFKCLECDLEFKVGCGVGGSPTSLKACFFCEDCNKVSIQAKCEYCGKQLKRIIFPIKGRNVQIEERDNELTLKCPQCSSDHTILTLLDKWVVNYQIW